MRICKKNAFNSATKNCCFLEICTNRHSEETLPFELETVMLTFGYLLARLISLSVRDADDAALCLLSEWKRMRMAVPHACGRSETFSALAFLIMNSIKIPFAHPVGRIPVANRWSATADAHGLLRRGLSLPFSAPALSSHNRS